MKNGQKYPSGYCEVQHDVFSCSFHRPAVWNRVKMHLWSRKMLNERNVEHYCDYPLCWWWTCQFSTESLCSERVVSAEWACLSVERLLQDSSTWHQVVTGNLIWGFQPYKLFYWPLNTLVGRQTYCGRWCWATRPPSLAAPAVVPAQILGSPRSLGLHFNAALHVSEHTLSVNACQTWRLFILLVMWIMCFEFQSGPVVIGALKLCSLTRHIPIVQSERTACVSRDRRQSLQETQDSFTSNIVRWPAWNSTAEI